MPNQKITTYKSKRIDILYFWIVVLLTALLWHVQSSFLGRRNSGDFEHRLNTFLSPAHYLMTFIITLIFCSPLWVFRRRYPRSLTIDAESRTITLVKRKKAKPLVLQKNLLSYNLVWHTWYATLDFYYIFYSSRGAEIKKRVFRVVALRGIFSFNFKVLRSIESDLKNLDMSEVEDVWKAKDENGILD